MSRVSSYTGLSSTSSFGGRRRGSWCTPPRLFLEDQVTTLKNLMINDKWLHTFRSDGMSVQKNLTASLCSCAMC
jgi:hypothetical protein